MFKISTYILVSSLGLFLSPFFTLAGTVSDPYKYAWSNNVGYINFENIIVTDSSISGYAWSTNTGWIKMDPSMGGVLNDGQGNLSGFAWGEGLGWIDFDNVTISTTTGKFSGQATGTIIGILTFDCSNYCDVKTDWRPGEPLICTSWTYSNWSGCSNKIKTRTILNSFPSGCYGGSPVLTQSCTSGTIGSYEAKTVNEVSVATTTESAQSNIPSHIEAVDQNLIINSNQSGIYIKNTSKGKVTLEILSGSVSSKITFYIEEEPLADKNNNLLLSNNELVNGLFFNITAKDQFENLVNYFSRPITISLPLNRDFAGDKNLGVYWLNKTNNQWVLIPDAVFSKDKVTFKISYLTKFAIFKSSKNVVPSMSISSSTGAEETKEVANTLSKLVKNNIWNWLVFTIVILFLILFKIISNKRNN